MEVGQGMYSDLGVNSGSNSKAKLDCILSKLSALEVTDWRLHSFCDGVGVCIVSVAFGKEFIRGCVYCDAEPSLKDFPSIWSSKDTLGVALNAFSVSGVLERLLTCDDLREENGLALLECI